MVTINIGKTLQSQMLQDFEVERQECSSLLAKCKEGSDLWNRCTLRIRVIGESVEELRKSISNPDDFKNRQERGYTEDELQRLKAFKEMRGNMKDCTPPKCEFVL